MTGEVHPHASADQERQSIWVRGLLMLLFVLIYGVAEVVVATVAIIQFAWAASTEEPNPRLAAFGASLSVFVCDVVRYWTFDTEEKPFPFADWPHPDGNQR